MIQRRLYVRSLILAFALVLIAGTTGSAATPVDSKIREAIERTQTLQAAINRCLAADDKACAEGYAFAKLAKEAAERAMEQSELKDGAKSYLRTAIDNLLSAANFVSSGRAAEAVPITNNALSALYEADKAA